ncbi:transcription factor TGA7 isoform X2 [Ziziphus jujuba]|uniref:Transcription factor TGA7 isoform X2 n=1 Tax=Ziziphus jujuba TaxID=326968 RepID=A0A6P4AGN1_ZIZJJ|nr:transcription factor TGA7 isoform X2 [Ziziphus jujuba]
MIVKLAILLAVSSGNRSTKACCERVVHFLASLCFWILKIFNFEKDKKMEFATSRQMGIYEPFRQVSMWKDTFGGDNLSYTGASTIGEVDAKLENKFELVSHESVQPSGNDEEGNKSSDKAQRRLAQNREAARKSRLRKKAYVQQLETSRLKLAQLEQELERSRKQGLYVGSPLGTSHVGFSGTVNSGIMAFEMEYGHWVEEQHKQNCELRNALQAHAADIQLRMLVESALNHYYSLFRMKADAAKADVFYLVSGIWRTSAERFFLWIGGFRPSELLTVLLPQIEPLTDQQVLDVGNLQHSSQQAEDALSQGIDKLQQSLAHTMAADPMSGDTYGSQMAAAVEKLDELESFVSQADHLREQTLRRMSSILTTHQAARGLLALGEYFRRLRALSSLWAARPCEPV